MALLPTTRFTTAFKPLTQITPTTFRDGYTFLDLYENLRKFLEDVLTPELDAKLAFIYEQTQAEVDRLTLEMNASVGAWEGLFNAFMDNVTAELEALNDQAMTNLLADPASLFGAHIRLMFPERQWVIDSFGSKVDVDTLNTLVASGRLSSTSLNSAYAKRTDVDALNTLTDTGRLGQSALDVRYAKRGSVGVSALDYGADPTGIGDSTNALNTMFALGGNMTIPPGDYRITAGLIVGEGANVFAYGARIFRDSLFSFVSNIPTSDVTTTAYNGPGNITINGGVWDSRGNVINSDYANAFTWAHASNIVMRDCVILDVAGAHGVEFDGIDGALLDNVWFQGFYETPGRSFSEAVQIDTCSTDRRGKGDMTICKNIKIKGGTHSASKTLPSYPRGIGSHSAFVEDKCHENILIEGVSFIGMRGKAIRAYGWSNVMILNNFINGGCSANAIEVATPTVGGTGGAEAYVKNILIQGNQLINVVEDGIYLNATGAKNIQRAIIRDNIIDNPGFRGIYLDDRVDNSVIDSNTITAPGNAGVTVNLSGGTTIRNNRFRRSTTESAAINIIAGTVGTLYYGNDARGYPLGVNNLGSGSINGGNNLEG